MTSRNRGTTRLRPDDEHAVDEVLADAGFPNDARLRQVLMQLRALRDPNVPPPSAELRKLMEKPPAADIIPLDQRRSMDQRRPWEHRNPNEPGTERRKPRVAFTALAVAASLGVAGGAAAGNETFRSGAEGTISTIVRSLIPAPPAAPSTPAPAPAPAVLPAPDADAPSLGAGVAPPPAGKPAAASSPPAQADAGPGHVPAQDGAGAAEDPAEPPGGPESPRGASSAAPRPAEQGGKDAARPPADPPAEVDAPGAIKQEQPGEANPQERPGSQINDAPRPTATKQDPQH